MGEKPVHHDCCVGTRHTLVLREKPKNYQIAPKYYKYSRKKFIKYAPKYYKYSPHRLN
jgi:hypothetical protein